MTKIEVYKEAKAKAESLRQFAKKVADKKNADKFGAKVELMETYLGFSGNSSVYGWGQEVVEAMKLQIVRDFRETAQRIAARAEEEAEEARKSARKEAEEILQEIDPQS